MGGVIRQGEALCLRYAGVRRPQKRRLKRSVISALILGVVIAVAKPNLAVEAAQISSPPNRGG